MRSRNYHLCLTVFSMAILVVGTAYEVNGATIPADPLAAEGAVDDNQCSLHEAIAEANTPGTHSGGSGLEDECSPGSAGADIIMLTVGGLYNLTQVDSSHFGNLGLPLVESVVSIYGRGATVRRDPSYETCDGTYPDFRLFAVSGGGAHLTLDLLEHEILPLFYERDADGVPRGWVRMIKNSLRSNGPRYCTGRMLRDYVNEVYTRE